MRKLDDKIALVTGASSGIGKGIACGLASAGAKVVLAARHLDRLQNVARQIESSGGTSLVLQTDVTLEDQVVNLFQRTVETFQHLDILINNAGVVEGGPLEQLTLETWDRVIGTNLKGAFLCTREAMRIMKPRRSGRIINIGSISAQRPRAKSAAYSASKFGLWGLTLTTALEGREYGISASCLHPGNVRVEGPVSPDLAPPGEPAMDISEIAEVAILMASLPAHTNILETIVLPLNQPYLGRG